METPPLDAEAAAKKAKSKAAHRLSMLVIGWSWVVVAAVALYVAFSKGDLPPFLYGHLTNTASPAVPAIRPPAPPPLVHWRDWDEDLIKQAVQSDRLIFLNLTARTARDAHLMDETAYNQPVVAAYVEKTFIPVKVDADERPDLALRYGTARPTTALLLPSGELVRAAGAMPSVALLRWAQAVEEGYRRDSGKAPHEIQGARSIELSASGNSHDDVWGGEFADGRRREKLLQDQLHEQDWGYVARFLSDPAGGYYAGQECELKRKDGSVMEGEHYYAQDEARRQALGMPAVDQRFFASSNGATAAAVLDDRSSAEGARLHALKTLERWWKHGVFEGVVRRQMTSGVQGLLPDQIGLAEGFAAAFEATGDRGQLARAVALARASESRLMDEKSQALFDRPSWHELPADLDQLLVPSQNLEALRLYRRLVRDLPVGDPFRERLKARSISLADWLAVQRASLSSVELALLAADGYNGKEKPQGEKP